MIGSPPTLKVMLLEDNPGDAVIIQKRLENYRSPTWELTVFSTLAEALNASSDDFDAALSDMHLPDSRGIETVSALSQKHHALPIVALTDRRDEEFGSRVLAAGAQDFLNKADMSSELLERTLRFAIERMRSQGQIQAIVNNNSDALVVVDQEGKLKFINPAGEQLFERSAKEMEGELFGFPIGSDTSTELQIVKEGKPHFTEMRVSKLNWQGEPCYLASLRDITDRKRAEDLQSQLARADRLAAVGQLAAGVAHEVNNPAGVVLGCLQTLNEEVSQVQSQIRDLSIPQRPQLLLRLDDISDMLRDSQNGLARITSLIKELSAFSRSDQDELELLDINDLVESVCAMTFNKIRYRAQLQKSYSDIPKIVGERGKLAQVLTNLLLNAAQAIEEGNSPQNYVKISTSVENNEIQIRVQDTGAGIPKSQFTQIFEPFYTTKARGVGTGLGLSLSGEIVRRHGGQITVESQVNVGSEFTVTLPVDNNLVAKPEEHRQPSQLPQRRARILVIDDEEPLLKVYKRLLKKRHEVVTIPSGKQALEHLRQDSAFDVVLCDLMMPELDGVGVFEGLTKVAPALKERTIFCTGGIFSPRARDFLESVSNVVLKKPIPPEDLFDEIDALMHRVRVDDSPEVLPVPPLAQS